MVQIYAAGNENFSQNGDAVLICFSCKITAELNGSWVLELEVPIDKEGRWKLITENAVLKVPTWQEDDQLYRISSYTKSDTGVSAVAYPIFYDCAKDVFLMDVRPTSATGQEALNAILADTPYSGSSNIDTAKTAYFVRRNALDAISGSDEPTFIGRWGGEILYDNYNIIINDRVGGDYGVEARYGKNIDGVQYTVDMTDVITRIVPVAYNGHTMSGDEPWVDSPNINSYPVVYTREVKYEWIKMAEDASDQDEEDVTICDTQDELDAALQAAAEADFDAGCDAPKVSMDINMVIVTERARSGVEELTDPSNDIILDSDGDEILVSYYRDYATLGKVLLGDTIHCRHRKLDITSEARVIEITWDCLRKAVAHVTLGDYQYNYIKDINQSITRSNAVIREDGSVMAEKVQGFLDGQQTMLRTQYNLATRQDTMAILFENLDEDSDMYGALGIGTQGLCISKTRSADGRDWVWTTGATANGLNAEMGIFGILADKSGYNSINLNTGELHLGSDTAYVDFDPSTGTFEINADAITSAASTATGYLYYDSTNGLVITATGGTAGPDGTSAAPYNTQIDGQAIRFRNRTTVLGQINGDGFILYRPGETTLTKAMELTSDGLFFYKPNGTSVSARYTSYGLEIISGEIGDFTIANGSIDSNDVHIGSDGISLGSYFSVDSNGVLTADRGVFRSANNEISMDLTNNTFEVDGRSSWDDLVDHVNLSTAGDSTINGENITVGCIHDPNNNTVFNLSTGELTIQSGSITLGGTAGNPNFAVTSAGYLTSISGTIGGWVIGTNSIHSESTHDPYVILTPSATGNDDIFSVRTGGSVYPFWVRADGYMHAAEGDIGHLVMTASTNGTELKSGQNGTPIEITTRGAISIVAANVYGDIAVTGGNIYINGSPISTSDKRLKTDWMPFDDRYENAYMEMEPVRFMFKNFTEEDNHDRYHCGFLAQDIETTFNKNGIPNAELGLLCIKELDEPNKAGELTTYGLRYEEMVSLNVHMIQKLYRRIEELERRLEDGDF